MLRGHRTPSAHGSNQEKWLKQRTSGPCRGMRSVPYTRNGARVYTSAPIAGRPTSHIRFARFISGRLPRANELLDVIHDVLYLESRRVDLLGVLGRMHTRRVALVTTTEIGDECIAADVGALRLAPTGANLGVRVEVDLDRRVGCDHRPDIASLDHNVALGCKRALPFAHHLAHGRVARDDGHVL